MKAKDLQPGTRVVRPPSERGDPPKVIITVDKVVPLSSVGAVRVTFTNGRVILMSNDSDVQTDTRE